MLETIPLRINALPTCGLPSEAPALASDSTSSKVISWPASLNCVTIPAWSTIGYGQGIDDEGRHVRFAGDHRPLRHLGEALARAEEPIPVEVEPWQVLSIEEARR